MGKIATKSVRRFVQHLLLPRAVKAEIRRDCRGSLVDDPGPDRIVRIGIEWLVHAQNRSISADGGVSRHFSLISGWAPSYPETTGYIVPTVLDVAERYKDESLVVRAERMLEWLVSIQFPDGSFQGGVIGTQRRVPVVFNTGQILIGLARGVAHFGDRFRSSMQRTADWLVAAQDADGCWRRFESPFAKQGLKTYDTHTAWGLLDAARVADDKRYAESGLRNVDWALSHQRANGWFDHCCLSDPQRPLTHTIGYTLRGIIEAFSYSQDQCFLDAAKRTADGILNALKSDGFLPGRLDENWHGTAKWACLTGSSQVACCWLLLHKITSNDRYLEAAFVVNRFVRRTIATDGSPDTIGAVKGSFPINGGYRPLEYLNWACKFTIDANLLELDVTGAIFHGI